MKWKKRSRRGRREEERKKRRTAEEIRELVRDGVEGTYVIGLMIIVE